jgi:hypothetical protein
MNHLRLREKVKLREVGNALKRPLAPALSRRERAMRSREQKIAEKNLQAFLLGLLRKTGKEG